MIINTNISAVNSARLLAGRTFALKGDMAQLSSGKRINSAADDPAGLAVAQSLTSQVQGTVQAQRNAQDAVSFVQTASGYLSAVTSDLQRIRTLAIQSANGVYTDQQRGIMQQEVSQLLSEVNRTNSTAQFNNLSIFGVAPTSQSGSSAQAQPVSVATGATTAAAQANNTAANQVSPAVASGQNGNINNMQTSYTLVAHIGPNSNAGNDNEIALTLHSVNTNSLKLSGVNIKSQSAANTAITNLTASIQDLTTERARLGAFQNRLTSAINTLGIAHENLLASLSTVQDADISSAMVRFTKDQILNQANVAMLTQANLIPQTVLKLLNT